MIEKLKTIFWFLKKGYTIQIASILKRGRNENTRNESTDWCKANEISINAVFEKLKIPQLSFKDQEKEYFEYALSKEKECPIQMGGRGAIDILYSIVKSHEFKNTLETGVAYGWSSLAILAALPKDGILFSNDMPYPKLNNEDFVGIVVPEKFMSKWKLHRFPDVIGLPKIFKSVSSFDLIHYDSDKSYQGRRWSQPILWDKLNKGGYFISDDINDNIAFKDFCEKIGKKPMIFKYDSKFVGILKKD